MALLDYIKCTFPLVSFAFFCQISLKVSICLQSFTVMSICWGATDFGKGMYDIMGNNFY